MAVLVFLRVRHVAANELSGLDEVELDGSADDDLPAAREAASSEGAYHNVISRGARRQDGPASQAGAYHNVKHAREPRNEGAYHNVATATRQTTEEGAYHNVTRAGEPRKEGAYHNVQRAVEEAENQETHQSYQFWS